MRRLRRDRYPPGGQRPTPSPTTTRQRRQCREVKREADTDPAAPSRERNGRMHAPCLGRCRMHVRAQQPWYVGQLVLPSPAHGQACRECAGPNARGAIAHPGCTATRRPRFVRKPGHDPRPVTAGMCGRFRRAVHEEIGLRSSWSIRRPGGRCRLNHSVQSTPRDRHLQPSPIAFRPCSFRLEMESGQREVMAAAGGT
jgi:hypothetical protein